MEPLHIPPTMRITISTPCPGLNPAGIGYFTWMSSVLADNVALDTLGAMPHIHLTSGRY